MKVLIFTDEFEDRLFTFIYNEIQGLKKNDVEVRIICERWNEEKKEENVFKSELTKNKLLLTIFLQLKKYGLYKIQSILFKYIRFRRKQINDFNPDIVHFHFGDTCTKFFFHLRNEIGSRPFFVSFHGFDASQLLNDNEYVLKLKQISKNSNFNCIYVAQQLRFNLLNQGIELNKNNSNLLHYGIDLDFFNLNKRFPKDNKKFIQISSFFEKKGHEFTIKAFALFKKQTNSDAKLILAGDGPLRSSIMKIVLELNLENEVVFTGWVSRTEAKELLSTSNYFLHHSVTSSNGDQEGIPNAIIEAMAMELPIISTWHSGIPELVEDQINGYLVAEKDIVSYADSMRKILTWGYLNINREKVMSKFSNQAHSNELLKIYSSAINKNNNS